MPGWIAGAIALSSVYGAHEGGKAAEKAADIQAQAAEAGAAESARQFDITQEQLAPYREAGYGALEQQQIMAGLRGPEAQAQFYQQYAESPAQQFLRQRQERALIRNQAAIGGLGGGNIRRALQREAAGYAMQDIDQQFNRLASISGTGQTTATNLASLRAQQAQQQGQFGMQAAGAQASGILSQQQIQNQMMGNLLQAGAMYYGSRPYSAPTYGTAGTR